MPFARWALPVLLALSQHSVASAEVSGAPDVLVIGDSQLTFGAGVAFVDLIQDMAGTCGIDPAATVGVIGVRSSTLRGWTGQTAGRKSAICDVDPTWNVNAGAYGSLSQGDSPFVQIGRGEQFQFCRSGLSPLQAVFDDGYYRPDLLVMFLLGNAAERWAGRPEDALADVQGMVADLPPRLPCIFMTTAPPYRRSVVELRMQAQDNIERAFAVAGRQCSFVRGFTTETIAANLGNAAHFRRGTTGEVRDPYHPTEAAARAFLELKRAALCAAFQTQLGSD